MNKKIMKLNGFIVLIIIFSLTASACGATTSNDVHANDMASEDMLSVELQTAPTEVKEAFLFAIANPDILSQMPCYCGCGGMGHMSNLDCYIDQINSDGTIIFDYHAYG